MFNNIFVTDTELKRQQAAYNAAQAMLARRGSGRTFRKCMTAVLAASSGRKVAFYYNKSMEMHALADECARIAGAHINSRTENYMQFDGGGYVQFVHMSNEMRGTKVDLIVTDELLGATWRDIQQWQENTKYIVNGEKHNDK